jgi:arylsulfatase A-like enzyme
VKARLARGSDDELDLIVPRSRGLPGRNARVWAALAALTLACGDPATSARGVVARAGSNLALGRGTEDAAPHKLGGGWRHALDSSSFLLAVPEGADTLAWSCGGGTGSETSFTIELRESDGPWRPFDESRLKAWKHWQDFERPIPPGTSRSLRFRAQANGASDPPLWGSIRFLGPIPARRRPDVLMLSLDTLGAGHLGAYGGPPGVSPYIDDLLSSSVSFERAYAQYGNTLVSHSSLFSALHPVRHGVYGGASKRRLAASLVGRLAEAGYETLAFTDGGYVSAGFGFGQGFDHYDDGKPGPIQKWRPGAAFDEALRRLSGRSRDEHVFLFVHTYEVHNPYLPLDEQAFAFADGLTPGDDRRLSSRQQASMLRKYRSAGRQPPARDLARLEALHRAEIRSLDARLAAFLEAAIAHLNDPVVVLLSDHGEQFGEWGRIRHGSSLHDRVIRVPLAFRVPGIEPRSIATPVQLVDVMPTLLDLLDLPIPAGLDGRSLVPWFHRGGESASRPAFAEQGSDNWGCDRSVSNCRVDRVAVVEQRFKLVDDGDAEVRRRLYDLQTDPREETNVAPDHPEVVARLSALALEYRARAPGSESDAAAPTQGLDEETLEHLRALGYEVGDP